MEIRVGARLALRHPSCSCKPSVMSSLEARAAAMLDAEPLTSVEERERLLLEVVVALAKALRDERDRLSQRLAEVEHELESLPVRLGTHPGVLTRRPLRAVPPIDPSRKTS